MSYTAASRATRTGTKWERSGFPTAEGAARELVALMGAGAPDDAARRLAEGETVRVGGYAYFVRPD